MADSIITSALKSLNSFKWYTPTRDNTHDIADENDAKGNTANASQNLSDPTAPKDDAAAKQEYDKAKQKIILGIGGVGSGVPIIAPQPYIGACFVTFKKDDVSMPDDLKSKITEHPRVKNIEQEFNSVGFAAVCGFDHATFFYVDTDKQYLGASVGGISFLGLDPHNSFISVVASTKAYDFTANDSVADQDPDDDPHTDISSSHVMLNLGFGKDVSLNIEYAKHLADVEDVPIGSSEEFVARLTVHDVAKLLDKDSKLSLDITPSINNKREAKVKFDFGTASASFGFKKVFTKDWKFTGLQDLSGQIGLNFPF